MPTIGWPEILIILAIVLLIFGPTQLPKLAKMFGKAARSLKDGMEGKGEDEEPKKPDTAEKRDDSSSDKE